MGYSTLKRMSPAALQLKRILVPVDFSTPSQDALRIALLLAKQFHARITLLHVVERTGAGTFMDVPARLDHFDEQFAAAENNLRTLSATPPSAGTPSISTEIRSGLPAHEIVEAAQDCDADLIVIATRGDTGSRHFCIGSTAERVVRAAPCPVFVVREKEHDSA